MKNVQIDYSLYLVTDSGIIGDRNFETVIWEAVKGGCTVVQLREKGMHSCRLLQKAHQLKNILKPTKAKFIINDDARVAIECGADGVHLGQNDMAPAEARKIMGEEAIIGLSVETLLQARKAESELVDYLGVSPVFPSPTKTDTEAPWGLDGLKKLRKETKMPLVAIGGIQMENVMDVIKNGADGVAVVSAICGADDPRKAAQALRNRIDSIKKSK